LDAADSGRLRIDGLMAPPYREEALLEAGAAFRHLCRVTGRAGEEGLSVEIEVLPEARTRSREVALGFLNHVLDLSIRNHLRCR
jgi:hypothetical protein